MVSAIEKQSEDLISEYETGKETAVIRCSLSDYYTDFGELKVSPNSQDASIPMVIPLHSEVVPLVLGAKGEEPLSRYTNGLPKIFKVLGRNIIYDGELMQELHLQEAKYR